MLHIIKMYKGMISGLMESRFSNEIRSAVKENMGADGAIDAKEAKALIATLKRMKISADTDFLKNLKGNEKKAAGEVIRLLESTQKAVASVDREVDKSSVNEINYRGQKFTREQLAASDKQWAKDLLVRMNGGAAAQPKQATSTGTRDSISHRGQTFTRDQLMASNKQWAKDLLAKMNGAGARPQRQPQQRKSVEGLNTVKYLREGVYQLAYVDNKIQQAKDNYRDTVHGERHCPPHERQAKMDVIRMWEAIKRNGCREPDHLRYTSTHETEDVIMYGDTICNPTTGEGCPVAPKVPVRPTVKPPIKPTAPVRVNFGEGECPFDGIYKPRETVVVEQGASIQQIENQIKNVPAGYSLIRTNYGDNYYAVSHVDMTKIKVTSSGFLDSTWMGNPRGLLPILNQGHCKPVYQINVVFTGNGNDPETGEVVGASTTTRGGGGETPAGPTPATDGFDPTKG